MQRQKKLVEEEEHKQLLEKRAQYVEATKNLLKFTPAAEIARVKGAAKKVTVYTISCCRPCTYKPFVRNLRNLYILSAMHAELKIFYHTWNGYMKKIQRSISILSCFSY